MQIHLTQQRVTRPKPCYINQLSTNTLLNFNPLNTYGEKGFHYCHKCSNYACKIMKTFACSVLLTTVISKP